MKATTPAPIFVNLYGFCPRPRPHVKPWGDYYYTMSFAEALVDCGVAVRVHFIRGRSEFLVPDDVVPHEECVEVDISISGGDVIVPSGLRPHYVWLIYLLDELNLAEFESRAHVFVASKQISERLDEAKIPNSILLQGTDPTKFYIPKPRQDLQNELVFIGNLRHENARREPIIQVVEAGLPIKVWGRGKWPSSVFASALRGEFIPNENLVHYYANAKAVLNNHMDTMIRDEFFSNRGFDVLASGSVLVTEEMSAIPSDLRELIYTYSPGEVVDAATRALADPRSDRAEIAAHVRQTHSFANRAEQMLEKIMNDQL